MKEQITKFDLEAAFKALDEIEIPKVKGIRPNKPDLKEAVKRVDRFEALFEDYYDVRDQGELEQASEDRGAEVAQAKLARIEKIVDLDADSPDDLLPSYVGKVIMQCPQCMTLFYKNPEDIEHDEENPDVVNINEICQHCGNDSGYTLIGKVAAEEPEETYEEPTEEYSEEEVPAEEETTEEETEETYEEEPVEEEDLNVEEEIPEEEEEANESLNKSKMLKDFAKKSELETEYHSENLTLNEDVCPVCGDDVDEPCEDCKKKLEKEEVEESLNNSKLLKDIAKKNELETENHSENLTLNEATEEVEEEPVEEVEEEQIIELSSQDTADILQDLAAKVADAVQEVVEPTEEQEEEIAEKVDEIVVDKVQEVCPECEVEVEEESEDAEEESEEVEEELHEDAISDLQAFVNGLDEDLASEQAVNDYMEELPESCEGEECKEACEGENCEEEKEIFEDVSDAEFKAMINNPIYYESLEEAVSACRAELEECGSQPIVEENECENCEEDFDEIEDVVEESFNKHISDYLTEVYSNIKNFELVGCEMKDNKLVLEGKINFNSGKSKYTTFNFVNENKQLVGDNDSLAEGRAYTVDYKIKDKALIAEGLSYKYTINKTLVEGYTNK